LVRKAKAQAALEGIHSRKGVVHQGNRGETEKEEKIAEKFEAARGPEPPKITEEERRRRVERSANLLIQAALQQLR